MSFDRALGEFAGFGKPAKKEGLGEFSKAL
jgi:hypothetical protein